MEINVTMTAPNTALHGPASSVASGAFLNACTLHVEKNIDFMRVEDVRRILELARRTRQPF